MWPSSQTMSGLLQFALSVISLVAARLYDHWRRLHAQVRKHTHAASVQLRVRSAHNAPPARHKRTAAIHSRTTLGERAADGLAASVGSWRFIVAQSIFILVWIILNTVAFITHWDPYPWILLNLCMSTQAMYTGPIVMLSQNRQAAKDRIRDDQEAREVDLMTKQLKLLETINRQQLEILKALHQRPPEPPTQPSSRS